jgi:hypothetical protein
VDRTGGCQLLQLLNAPPATRHPWRNVMPLFLIERDLPGAGRLTREQLHGISARSNQVLAGMTGRAQWVESYVTDDAITCVYVADSADDVREHAECGGFPVTTIRRIGSVLDPTTGDTA